MVFTVTWSPEDEEWVATCSKWPSMSWLEHDPVRALGGLIDAVDRINNDLGAGQS